MDKEFFAIVDRKSNTPCDIYVGIFAHNQMFFDSVSDARNSNCNGIYADKTKYGVAKYKLVKIEDDVDPPTKEEIEESKRLQELNAKWNQEADEKGILDSKARIGFLINKEFEHHIFLGLKKKMKLS